MTDTQQPDGLAWRAVLNSDEESFNAWLRSDLWPWRKATNATLPVEWLLSQAWWHQQNRLYCQWSSFILLFYFFLVCIYIYRGEDHHCLSVCFNTDAIFLHLPRCISHMLTNEKRESNVPGYRFSTHSSKLEMEVICNRQPKPIKTNETSACPDVFEKLIRQSWTLETSELFVQLLFFLLFSTSFRKLFQVLSSV